MPAAETAGIAWRSDLASDASNVSNTGNLLAGADSSLECAGYTAPAAGLQMDCGQMRPAFEGETVILRTVVTWFVLVAFAFANGAVREVLLVPRIGPAAAHVVSTITLCALIVVVAWLATGWIGPTTARAAVTVGLLWLLMTLSFEFLVGHFLFGKAWPVLFADYNLLRGRVWIFVPIVTMLAPYFAWRLRTR
jgi:hypothetical protein